MKHSYKGALFLLSAATFAEPALADNDREDQAYNFCELIGDGSAEEPTTEQIRDAFSATGYISTLVCNPSSSPADDDDAQSLAGNYTRWVVEPADGVSSLDGQRVYSFEGRGWLNRLFTDRVIDTAHFLEITMSAPDVNFSIPLTTFKYNEEGENGIEYTTTFRQHAFNQTFFRVDSNTTSNIVARGRHSRTTSVSGIAETLTAVQNVVQLIAPSATLLTSVNSEQVSNTSNAINSVAGSLFNNSYDETVEDGFSLSDWHPERKLLVIVQFPFEVTSNNRNPRRTVNGRTGRQSNDEAIYRAYWLGLACPRESIFNTEDLCGNGKRIEATTRSVLNFQMATNKTVQQYLSDQQWYKDFLTSTIFTEERTDENANSRKALMQGFCRSMENEFYSAGFNSPDVKQIVRAAINGMPELASKTDSLTEMCVDDSAFESRATLAVFQP